MKSAMLGGIMNHAGCSVGNSAKGFHKLRVMQSTHVRALPHQTIWRCSNLARMTFLHFHHLCPAYLVHRQLCSYGLETFSL